MVSGSAAPPGFPPDRLLGGKFRLDRLIGQGAMGIVYAATDLSLRRPVAIKVMSEHLMHPDLRRARC